MRASSTICRTAGVLFALVACVATATPYRPANDSEIIETLPGGTAPAADRATRALRVAVARDPQNLDLALRLAGLYVTRARIDSDPRQLGRAQAVLAPWWDAADSPVPVLVLRATIEQSNHVFADARTHLERALAQQPTNAQAWLTLATVQQVTGDLAGAAESCRRLADVAVAMVAVTCQASVDGLTGRATPAYDALNRVLAQSPGSQTPVSLRSWATTLQAEIAERLGRSDDAERLYRASRALDPHDAYTIAAYADFLLDEQRNADVVDLIPRDTPVDTLLLRRVQAAIRSGAADATSSAEDLGQRFAALRARGDRVHLREEARYTLEVLHSPDAALALALENWRVQKEPLDARIALESALTAHRPQAAREVLGTIASSHLESERIAERVREAAKP